jgi:preprotein translocase subunit Sec61beta
MAGSRARLAGILVVALASRLAFGLLYWTDQPLTRDEREYLSLGRSLAAGRGFVYDEAVGGGPVDPFGRAPGYPAWLALVGPAEQAASVPAGVKMVQSLAGCAGVWLVYVLARRVAGPRSAEVAAALAAVYPPLVWIAGYAMSEAIYWPLGLAASWAASRTLEPARSEPRHALAAGLLSGVAILVRPAHLLFLPAFLGWLVWRRRGQAAALVLAASVAIVGPWTARNYAHHGRFVLVASEGGVTFWTGNHPEATGEGDMAANPQLKVASLALRARHPSLSEEAMEPVYYREALAWMAAHPMDWLRLELRKAFFLVVPIGPSYALHSARYELASIVSYALVALGALAGWLLGGRHARAGLASGLWLLAGSAVATSLVFFPQERFRIPVIDPTLIVSASLVVAAKREEGA